jgi:hypothetical protein
MIAFLTCSFLSPAYAERYVVVNGQWLSVLSKGHGLSGVAKCPRRNLLEPARENGARSTIFTFIVSRS